MDSVQVSNSIPRTALRPDDLARLPRDFRLDNRDRPRAASEDRRFKGETRFPPRSMTPVDDSPPRENGAITSEDSKGEKSPLSLDETFELFKRKIEAARQETKKALEGSEDVSEDVRPKLTLDLGHSRIQRLPETVVDLIKLEVERLSLSHNQIWFIPLRFSECSQLRYLNIRVNVFREIPRGAYKLPLLEILDVSRNKVRKISKEIKNLTSLRVLSLMHNQIDDLPLELSEMNKLQVLKITDNPLRFRLKKLIETREAEIASHHMNPNEVEIEVTAEIKRYLKDQQANIVVTGHESGGETSEGGLDTPKPPKRAVTSRFPVIPSLSSSEALSDLASKSPAQGRPPPIPTKSHYRNVSGLANNPLRRPGLQPLISSERNRSNSESFLQASAAARSKRMGMLRKDRPDLDVVEETRVNRLSHLRGYSHGSVLRSRSSNVSTTGSVRSASPNSPRETRKHRLGFVKRLSSLPEHRRDERSQSAIVEGVKSVLYALFQVHPHISGLITALRGKDSKRSSLEITFYNASSHVIRLNDALEHVNSLNGEDRKAVWKAERTLRRDCATCIMAYTHVASQMQDNISKIVADVDPRYLRTLMLMLYGSMIEMRNAVTVFGAKVIITSTDPPRKSSKEFQTARDEVTPPQRIPQLTTPTRDRAVMPARMGTRMRSDTTIQHSAYEAIPDIPPIPQQHLPNYQQANISLTGSTLNGTMINGSISSVGSGGTMNSTMPSGLRSRSDSRTTNHFTFTNPSVLSSFANTPRSGEAFSIPPINSMSSRINPATGLTDPEEEMIFESVFLSLSRAYDSALQAIPIARRQFTRCLDAAEDDRYKDLWKNLIWRCKTCLEVSEALKAKLLNMSLKEPAAGSMGAVHGRNDRAFWQLCKTFMHSFVDLVTEMKEAKDLRVLPQEIVIVLKPVQKASQEAGRLIKSSPWGSLSDAGSTTTPFTNGYPASIDPYANGVNGNAGYFPVFAPSQMQHYPSVTTNGITTAPSSVPPSSTGASPVSVPLPATPLSAALGPAAQATIPSTPANAYTDQFFAGNVFQRADSLLNMPQAGNLPFVSRR